MLQLFDVCFTSTRLSYTKDKEDPTRYVVNEERGRRLVQVLKLTSAAHPTYE